MYIGGDLGQAVGPILGGVVAQQAGYGNMYMLSAIPIAVAWVYFVLIEIKRKKVVRCQQSARPAFKSTSFRKPFSNKF